MVEIVEYDDASSFSTSPLSSKNLLENLILRFLDGDLDSRLVVGWLLISCPHGADLSTLSAAGVSVEERHDYQAFLESDRRLSQDKFTIRTYHQDGARK